ncbi:MAG TPA: hypothetical protein VD863_09720 [Bradyrhizobium sp.]|jgi:hypothetical protein|nr:hypothetical protein [Bradyrhizobium sp.]
MNESEFEAKLKADGYTEITNERLEPRPGKGHHDHHFAIRGLVLDGTFTVNQNGQSTTYTAGQIFDVADGYPHDESIGPEGARVIIGRKYAKA